MHSSGGEFQGSPDSLMIHRPSYRGGASREGSCHQTLECTGDLFSRPRAHQPFPFDAASDEDQRWPQLDAEGSAERPARSIFDPDVPDTRMLRHCSGDGRLRRGAHTAPRGSEFEHRRLDETVDLFAAGLVQCHALRSGFTHDRRAARPNHSDKRRGQCRTIRTLPAGAIAAAPCKEGWPSPTSLRCRAAKNVRKDSSVPAWRLPPSLFAF